jgi:ATP-dependent helicase HrpA
MIEELRVSLFAQTLGTSGPVSEKRVRAAIAAVAASASR